MYVPCGHCSACLLSRSQRWVERLEHESRNHRYQLFVTLTYDDAYIPVLSKLGSCFHDPDRSHVGVDKPRISFNTEDFVLPDDVKTLDYIDSVDYIYYLSHSDAQKFIKRLRTNLYRYLTRNNYEVPQSIFRYFLVGEYGTQPKDGKHFRPHYHCILWFDSEFEAQAVESLIRKSWKFGFVDSSFVSSTANSYVAKYLNCLTDLPSVYRHREIRPFAHFSKCPPIGFDFFTDKKIQEIFYNSTPETLYPDFKKLTLRQRSIWRTLQDWLFPKCSRFDRITHFDRVKLYGIASCFSSLEEFKEEFRSRLIPHTKKLLYSISSAYTIESVLVRHYYMSRHVLYLSSRFGVNLDTYVRHIEDYFSNLDYLNLKKQYEFQESFQESTYYLSWFDRLFIETCQDNGYSSPEDAPDLLKLQLSSYNIDINLFFNSDASIRSEYYDRINYVNSLDYQQFTSDMDTILKRSTKNKHKNSYLTPTL